MATLAEQLTVKNLTPPGYFNQAENAPQTHKNYLVWWNRLLASRLDDVEELRTLVLTPWLYEFPDAPRNPWVQYLLSTYGFAFFGGTNTQAAHLYKLISGSWYPSTIKNFSIALQTLSLPPLNGLRLIFCRASLPEPLFRRIPTPALSFIRQMNTRANLTRCRLRPVRGQRRQGGHVNLRRPCVTHAGI